MQGNQRPEQPMEVVQASHNNDQDKDILEPIDTSGKKKRVIKQDKKAHKCQHEKANVDDNQKPYKQLNDEAMTVLRDITKDFKSTFNSIKDHSKLKEEPLNGYEVIEIQMALKSEREKK